MVVKCILLCIYKQRIELQNPTMHQLTAFTNKNLFNYSATSLKLQLLFSSKNFPSLLSRKIATSRLILSEVKKGDIGELYLETLTQFVNVSRTKTCEQKSLYIKLQIPVEFFKVHRSRCLANYSLNRPLPTVTFIFLPLFVKLMPLHKVRGHFLSNRNKFLPNTNESDMKQ